jgi:KaiC/GvpD/RAD55 family RecA-like ATPase
MKHVVTGVNGLDYVLDGGFLRPSIVLIGGAAGTGKTTMALQSLFNAAKLEKGNIKYLPLDIEIIHEGTYAIIKEMERNINVIKMRGQDFSGGKHSYKITPDGFIVYPRKTPEARTSIQKERISTGIKGLDKMTDGGFMRGSDHDKDIRELIINKKGVEIKMPFSEYSGLLSGSPVKAPSDAFMEAFRK